MPSGESATVNTFTINVGPAPTIAYDISHAEYDSSTGDLVMNVGSHNHTEGTFLRLITNSINFTCDMDNNASTHSYPRSGDPAGNTAVEVLESYGEEYKVNGAVYKPNTGIMTLTVPNHGMSTHNTFTAKNCLL